MEGQPPAFPSDQIWTGSGREAGGSPGPHLGGCIPACTEADHPRRLLLRQYASYWNAFLLPFGSGIFSTWIDSGRRWASASPHRSWWYVWTFYPSVHRWSWHQPCPSVPWFSCGFPGYLQWQEFRLKARKYQASASALQQLCDDASDSVLIENNGVTWKWVTTPFWSDSIVCNENRIASIIAELSQRWRWRLV